MTAIHVIYLSSPLGINYHHGCIVDCDYECQRANYIRKDCVQGQHENSSQNGESKSPWYSVPKRKQSWWSCYFHTPTTPALLPWKVRGPCDIFFWYSHKSKLSSNYFSNEHPSSKAFEAQYKARKTKEIYTDDPGIDFFEILQSIEFW